MPIPVRDRPPLAREGNSRISAVGGDPEEAAVQESVTELDLGCLTRIGGVGTPPDEPGGGAGSFDPRSRSHRALQLQRTIGNAATIRTLKRGPVPSAQYPSGSAEVGPNQEEIGPLTVLPDRGGAGPPVLSGPGPAPIQRFPELSTALIDPPIEAPEAPQIETAAPTGEIQAAVQSGEGQVSGAGQAPAGGGGLLDAVVNQAKSWVTGKVSQAAGVVGKVGSKLSGLLGGPLSSAFNFAKNVGSGIVSTIKRGVTSVWSGIKSPLKTMQQGVGKVVRQVIQSASKVIRPLASTLGGMIRGLLNSGGDIVGAITGKITGAIAKTSAALAALPGKIAAGLQNAITAISTRIRAMAAAVAAKLTGMVTRIATTVSNVLSRATNAVGAVLSGIEGALRRIPSVIRSIVNPIVDRVLSTVRRVIETISKAVTSAVKKVSDAITKTIEAFRKKVDEKIDAATKALIGVAKKLADAIKRGVAKATKGIAGMIAGAKNLIHAIVKRVVDPIKNIIAKKLSEWIAPRLKEALKKGGGLKKMMAGIPKQIAGAAKGVAQKVADTAMITGHDVLRGLMRPDGDHFSFGISVGVSGEVGGGAGVAVTGTADLVLDYASHEIGVFFSPGVSVGAGGGVQAEAGPNVDLTGSWGSVLSFGANRGAGVRQGFQGAFVGAAVSANAEAGARVGRSEGLYVGAAPLYDAAKPLFDAASQGAKGGPPPLPPAPPPAPPVGIPVPPSPAPQTEAMITSQLVRFDTGKSNVKSEGRAAINNVLDATAHAHALHADAKYRLGALGGASLRYRHPGAGHNADERNMALSVQRAQVVAAEVTRGLSSRALAGNSEVQHGAMGSALGHLLHLPSDNNSEVFRATTLTSWEKLAPPPAPAPTPAPAPAPGGGGGGSPVPGPAAAAPGPRGDGSGPNTPSVGPGEINLGSDDRKDKGILDNVPNPLHGPLVPDLMHRPTIGWDSGVSLGVRPGVGVAAGASANATFSIPIAAIGFPPKAELPLRVATGIVKLGLDLMTMNIAGGLRDGVGIVGALVPSAIVDGIADFVFPLPPGYTD